MECCFKKTSSFFLAINQSVRHRHVGDAGAKEVPGMLKASKQDFDRQLWANRIEQ